MKKIFLFILCLAAALMLVSTLLVRLIPAAEVPAQSVAAEGEPPEAVEEAPNAYSLTIADAIQPDSSWQELYAQIAKDYHTEDERYRYALVYGDDDEVPELVADFPGYFLSLFTYKNGHTHCLMDSWPYGAGGNSGYSVIPRTGIYYNGNADYAGAVYYEYYMSAREEGELGTDYWVKYINFNDLDGDGVPSEEELEASREYTGTAEYHCETGREMTQEEIKAVLDLYDSYDMQYLMGELDYESLLGQLGIK